MVRVAAGPRLTVAASPALADRARNRAFPARSALSDRASSAARSLTPAARMESGVRASARARRRASRTRRRPRRAATAAPPPAPARVTAPGAPAGRVRGKGHARPVTRRRRLAAIAARKRRPARATARGVRGARAPVRALASPVQQRPAAAMCARSWFADRPASGAAAPSSRVMPANIRVAGTRSAADRNRGNSVTHPASGFPARAAQELHATVESVRVLQRLVQRWLKTRMLGGLVACPPV